jgi:hypothetical protein
MLLRKIYERIQMNRIVNFKGNRAERHVCASSNICRMPYAITFWTPVGAQKNSYCLCKKQNPKGLMVQCDYCKDWFHPECVGISPDEAENIPVYTCQECTLVDH